MEICDYSFEEYIRLITSFHGSVAPGMVIGGFMVDLAKKNLPQGEFFDVICETQSCLPDAIQLLTPCTIGNGWLKVITLGRYAMTFYEKYKGVGVRVFLDPAKIAAWPEIKNWYFKLKPKKEQDSKLLIEQIKESGSSILSLQHVKVQPQFLGKKHKGKIVICPYCGEAYPSEDGKMCRACQGQAPYLSLNPLDEQKGTYALPLKTIPIEQAIGLHALHDMTRIIPGKEKGAAIKRGQIITKKDIPLLQQMGKQCIYVEEENPIGQDFVHEDEAALAFVKAMAGGGVTFTKSPKEGRADLMASRNGLLVVDEKRLEMFNLIPGVMCASCLSFSEVVRGQTLAGTRAIPLFLPKTTLIKAMNVLGDTPLFEVMPLHQARVGILVTGGEVYKGVVEDKFIPIIRNKVEKYRCQVVDALIVPDDRQAIKNGVKRLLNSGADLIVTTAGLSIDPDDVTRQALLDAGVTDMLHGIPILPGTMTLMGHIGSVQVIGVPACALYFKKTSFDLLLPRMLAGLTITRHTLAHLGHGGLFIQ